MNSIKIIKDLIINETYYETSIEDLQIYQNLRIFTKIVRDI